ncbi:MAG: serine/threonine protein kinase [Nitrospirae bacterium]|nr:serine/threonine protein kinase [Nitrospirota bacterium]
MAIEPAPFNYHNYLGDRYVVNDIKEGGAGIVYLCYDKFLKAPVALKTFKFNSDKDWKTVLAHFISEAKKWIHIGQDIYVVQAYYIHNIEMEHGIVPFVAIEFIEGHELYGNSLRGFIAKASFNLELILNIAISICNGMLHIQNKFLNAIFVHCDLKPENILLSKEGSIKITDFGISKTLYDNSDRLSSLNQSSIGSDGRFSVGLTNNICGTPPYMSPEQCLGLKSIDQCSDIYSFGCILYEMCTKRFVFQTHVLSDFFISHISEVPISPDLLNPDIPSELSKLIQQCLSKDPKNRPQQFKEVRDILMNILNQEYGQGSGVRFFTFGFSGFTDKPRVKSDYNMSRENEALLLGKTMGVEYVIDQGLVSSKNEFDMLDADYEKNRDSQRKLSEYNRQVEKAEEQLLAGDSFLKLYEAAEPDEGLELIRSALNNYYFAQKVLSLEPELSFRIGIANFNLAGILRNEYNKVLLSDDYIAIAIGEFNSVLTIMEEPELISIGSQFYLLPYAALFYRAGANALKNEKDKASNDFNKLIAWLEKSNIPKYEGIKKYLIETASEGLELPND